MSPASHAIVAAFEERQRCTRYAALLDHLGWLPEVADALTSMRCANCAGDRVVYVRDCERAGWPHPPCLGCRGSGEVPAVARLTLAT